MRIVCASANPKKVAEITRMLPSYVQFIPRPDDVGEVEETAPTLEGNAVIKAVEVAHHVPSMNEVWAIADDTGLEVEALNGDPGVFSARFAGDGASDAENRALLLSRLSGESHRAARFRTVIALVSNKGEMHLLTGTCDGSISLSESGENGFGYDSIFVPADGDGRTFAEMTAREKDSMSHRGRALAQLPALIARITGSSL
jgi:XTP/dITP diphosphohydrolase